MGSIKSGTSSTSSSASSAAATHKPREGWMQYQTLVETTTAASLYPFQPRLHSPLQLQTSERGWSRRFPRVRGRGEGDREDSES